MKYACITRYRREYPVRLMCRVLGVAPAGYYAACRAVRSVRAVANERLRLEVRTAFRISDERYGAPRVHRELQGAGLRVGKKRVARLMREDGLVARSPRRWRVCTTDSTHSHPIAPNLLNRQFDVASVAAVNRVWVSDITFVPTRAGWLYLAVVLDLASRRVVGWAMGNTLEAELALRALRMALEHRRPAPGLVHHSDRGVQYACTAYRALLAAHGLEASMSRRGNCWDNAVAESFFATLELELQCRRDWADRKTAQLEIFEYIETWYNQHRRHSTLNYVSPAEYERQLQSAA